MHAGAAAAVRRGGWIDAGLMGFMALSQSVPIFWLALMLILVFAVWLRWLPASGSTDTGSLVTIEHPSGAIQVDLALDASGRVTRASLVRTARRIFEGNVIVPASAILALAERAETGGELTQ